MRPQRWITPTGEQRDVVEAFLGGGDLVVEAGAGAGKTSTLRLVADAACPRRVLYVGFNRAIVDEARRKMPRNVRCSTSHGLAFREFGRHLAQRLDEPWVPSSVIAERLGLGPLGLLDPFGNAVTVSGSVVAGTIVRSINRFCVSADASPSTDHLVLPPDVRASPEMARYLAGLVSSAWTDLCERPSDTVWPFTHNHYLKMWALTNPVIDADVILFDEAQDANPCVAAVVSAQSAQTVWVGDSAQAIYGFNGAVDAIRGFEGARRQLTQSFRFGPAIADLANCILAIPAMDTKLRIRGTESIHSEIVTSTDEAQACLTRTNAGAITAADEWQRIRRRRVAIVGGTKEVMSFAFAAGRLRKGIRPNHPQLDAFETWADMLECVADDVASADLASMVALVSRLGVSRIIDICRACVPEGEADMVISTAHKSKGREWDHVYLADDFPDDGDEMPVEEWRLLYVAVTRARKTLDVSRCAPLAGFDPVPRVVPIRAPMPIRPAEEPNRRKAATATTSAKPARTLSRLAQRLAGRRPQAPLGDR